jgi:hypothetical protein
MPDLNTFQIIFLSLLAASFLASIVATVRGWATRREGSVWGFLCLAAGIATVWPSLTGEAAEAVGIGRGADLVFYCAVGVMMIGFWMTYMRMRHLRHELTALVRHIAILEAQNDQHPPTIPPPAQDHKTADDVRDTA